MPILTFLYPSSILRYVALFLCDEPWSRMCLFSGEHSKIPQDQLLVTLFLAQQLPTH
jgi:hypothetical protein